MTIAREVLKIEAQGILRTRESLTLDFARAVELFSRLNGRVIVIGIGKSGLIGRKLSSTLTSTGTLAVFMHPVDALHGDLGLVTKDDAVLALSFSGETDEIKTLLPHIKALKVPVVAMTGFKTSRLARLADVTLLSPVRQEACPFNITPTASTSAMLALGDALAIALMRYRGFGKEDFARLHPGGNLGRRLRLKAKDLMRRGRLNPVVHQESLVREALLVMTRARSGAVSVVDQRGRLTGFFTDGDVRRLLNKNGAGFMDRAIEEVMTRRPIAVTPEASFDDLVKIFRERPFDNVPVVNPNGVPVGLVDERDLLE
ncbi:MAG: KpsF/GutQ family sugar-phosphate isomerase [Elusimicrobia bacterium]|nr:KpsF/GutQ family sugar-phosphate isomerase [Elusimicrobiota bacterium]